MSHAEALQTLHPAAGATDAIVAFVSALGYGSIPEEVRHYARRHLLDTVGVMIAGAGGEVASRAEAMLAAVRPAGRIPVPGRARRADLIDAAFLGGTAAHGIELDDGYRQGSVHPGCVVVPAVLALGYDRRVGGQALIEAVVAGYEADIAIGRACHPDLRQRGFHPAAAVGVFGAAMAAGKLRGLSAGQLANALGIAASSAAGLFAFVNGGADIKRLHAGHASREGLQAALLAEQGVEGPPDVIEARDGFMQAFAFGRADKARAIALPPAAPYRHHRLLHQAVSLLPPHPAGGRGAHRPAQRREDCERRGAAHRRRDLSHRRRARRDRLGRFRQRAVELSLSDVAGAEIPRHQVRAFHRGDAARPVVRGARPQAQRHGAARCRPALSAAAPGARDRDDRARRLHPPGRRGARLAHRAARRRRAESEVSRSGRAGARGRARRRNWPSRYGRSMRRATSPR